MSVHAYTPYTFALQIEGTKNFNLKTGGQRNDIIKFMDNLYNKYIANGIPVVIGEFGALDKGNLQDRVDFTAFYVASASERNLPCLWWDNNAYTGSGEKFGLLQRRDCTFPYPEIVEAIMTYGRRDQASAAE